MPLDELSPMPVTLPRISLERLPSGFIRNDSHLYQYPDIGYRFCQSRFRWSAILHEQFNGWMSHPRLRTADEDHNPYNCRALPRERNICVVVRGRGPRPGC